MAPINIVLLVIIMLFTAGFLMPLFLKSNDRQRKIAKRLRLILVLSAGLLPILAIILFFSFVGCDGRAIVGVEIGSFPDNIVYYAGESDTIDLTGGTVLVFTRGRGSGPNSVEIEGRYAVEYPMSRREYVPFRVVYDIDFSVPGVYEIHILWMGDVVGRIPVQVIER